MCSSRPIILYDLPMKGSPTRAWSLNPWKTRLYLNIKGLNYVTEWVEYPDIIPKFSKLGVPPHEKGTQIRDYTIPVVAVPNGPGEMDNKYIMESKQIALYLEPQHPSPSLQMDSPMLNKIEEIMSKLVPSLGPYFVPRAPRDILNPPSAEYFIRTREMMTGKSLPELEKGADDAWKQARPHLEEVSQLLKENPEGPFLLGKDVSYADIPFVGFLRFIELFGALDKVYEVDPKNFEALYDAFQPWLARDDH